QLSGLGQEISSLVQPLSSKQTAMGGAPVDARAMGFQLVPASYNPAPTAFSPAAFSLTTFSPAAFSPAAFSPAAFSPAAFRRTLKCYVRVVVYVVSGGLNNQERAKCACDPPTSSDGQQYCDSLTT